MNNNQEIQSKSNQNDSSDLFTYGSTQELDEIFTLLFNNYHLDFSQYRSSTISRRLVRRISLCKKQGLADYLTLLMNDPLELEALYGDFLLNFTEFFRDPQIFILLKKSVFPQLIEKKSVKSALRIWVPGCSSGEEVYSLAISLHEFLEDQKLQIPLQFFGTDLVEKNIKDARKGLYTSDIESQISPERLTRYFERVDQGYKVTRFIREQCAFSVQDLIHDPPFPRIDLISCRNVLIYLNETLQDRILPLFHYSLSPNGYLLLGTSESMGRYSDLFLKMDNQSNIFRRKSVPVNRLHYQSFVSPLSKYRSAGNSSETLKDNKDAPRISDAMDQILQKYYTPPALLVDSGMRIRQFRGDLAPYLKPSEGEASLLLSKMLPKGWLPDFIVAMEEAKKKNHPIKRSGIVFNDGESNKKIDYTLIPMEKGNQQEQLFCIIFDSMSFMENEKSLIKPSENDHSESHNENDKLRKELALIKSHLQTIIEEKEDVNQELWSANEEIQSTNEELLSVNEELEAAKEELESSNEELLTLNEELNIKNRELETLNAENKDVLDILNDSQMYAHIGTWWVVLPGTTVSWTEEAALICGFDFSVKSIENSELLRRIHPDDRADLEIKLFNSTVQETEEKGTLFSFRIQLPSGEIKHLEATRKTEYDETGNPSRVVGTIQDITERIQAEEKLKKSESFLTTVINSIQDGISVLDSSLNVIRVNPVMEKWYPDMIPFEGKKCHSCYHNRKEPCSPCPSLRALKSGKVEADIVAGAPGSSIEWLELYSYPMTDPYTGDINGVVEFVRDVTTKIRTERALEESEARLRRYVEAAPVGIIVNNKNGSLVDINDAACRLFGLTREEAFKRGAKNLLSPENRENVIEMNRSLIRDGHVSGEVRFLSDRGEHKIFLMDAVKLTNKGEFLSFLNDVTSQKELESQLHQSEKMQVVGQLAGGIAHDFNNQLTGILGYTDFIRETLPEDSINLAYLDSIINIVNRAADLTSQLLAFSRKGKYMAVKVDLHHIIAEVINLLQHSFDKKIVIKQDHTPQACFTMGDPTQLQNIILNLALNARDAMPGGGTITFETQRKEIHIPPPSFHLFDINPGQYVVVSVIDTGSGIPESQIVRIFEPFFTTKAQGKGTGMGLAAVYGTIKNHNGAIEVTSLEGKGSQFTFYLPSFVE